jgi:phytoene dehydrogenase-like protein
MSTAVVVGAGPNGLACAAHLARAGVAVTVIEAEAEIGGGTRSGELTVPGVLHDRCSAVHAMAVGAPALNDLGLERHGLEWAWPEVDLAHPLDGDGDGDDDAGEGAGAAMLRSIDATAAGLGSAGPAWKRAFGAPSAGFEALGEDIMRPLAHLPRHPLLLAAFGLRAAAPATALARALPTEPARALWGGVAAHAFAPLTRPFSASVGMALVCACHTYGWPVARGGSQAIAAALAAVVREHGGTIETGRRVRSLDELPAADAVVLDLAPGAVAALAGDRLPARVARAYRRYRHGPGAFKVDLAVEGGVPWSQLAARRAGTVHAIGGFDEIVAAERDVARGRMPDRPFVLVGQQYLADPTRSHGDIHPVWAYAHVPHGYDGDASGALLDQIERFAPGLRERIVGQAVAGPAELAARNANYVGGDILTGANTPWQTLVRPRLALDPYATGAAGLYVCSAATPPGAGAHGMNGYNAARSVLRGLR